MNVNRGDDSDFELTFTDVDGKIIDLTDGTVFFTVKKNKTDQDEDALIKKDIEDFDHPTTGICILYLTSIETAKTPGNYWYDIQFKDKGGRISSTYAGKFVVSQDITTRKELDIDIS
jgi:hypothetical protein